MSDSRRIAALAVRLTLALYFGAAGLFLLLGRTNQAEGALWLPTQSPVAGAILLLLGVLLATGFRSMHVAAASAIAILLILVAWLVQNPFHNTTAHLTPFLAAALFVYAARARESSFVVLMARLFLGAIFVAQGLRSWAKLGLVGFAEKVYVAPLADSWVPQPLLWAAGVTNPVIQLGTGILLILGLRTRETAAVVAAFLLSIFFGHLLADPFDRSADVHAYAMANFLYAIVILWLHPRGDRFSVDALRAS